MLRRMGHKNAGADTDFYQPGYLQRDNGFSHRCAAHAERYCELTLGR